MVTAPDGSGDSARPERLGCALRGGLCWSCPQRSGRSGGHGVRGVFRLKREGPNVLGAGGQGVGADATEADGVAKEVEQTCGGLAERVGTRRGGGS